jgi:NADH:quinone reductase (non-electrogenic)
VRDSDIPFHPQLHDMNNKTKILILGGGFGGVYTALRLDKTLARHADVEVTLVSSDNFLLFTPMLHEVASGDLNPSDIVNPIRRMLKRMQFVQADVQSIDLDAKRVHCTRDLRLVPLDLDYDHLVLALGSETNFFGMQGVAENAVTLKTLGDAALLRARVLAILEMASLEPDASVRKRMLTFLVAGGGFAGVETIGAINDLVHDALRYYPHLAPQDVRVVLIHPGEFVLPELGEKLGRYAQQKLAQRGVEIFPRTKVTGYVNSLVAVSSGEAVPATTLIWTAGVTPNPVIARLPCKSEKGRVVVDEFLEVPGFAGLWAIGDCAAVPDANTGGLQPPTAQHALRQARHAAKNIEAVLAGRQKKPFRFSTLGQLASIGHRHGVANILGMNFSGFIAWFLWRSVYLLKLPRLAKKTRVALSWLLEMIFSKDLEQMLTLRDVELISRMATSLRRDVTK